MVTYSQQQDNVNVVNNFYSDYFLLLALSFGKVEPEETPGYHVILKKGTGSATRRKLDSDRSRCDRLNIVP